MRFADSFTICQTAFTVMPSPHVLLTLLTLRNSFPRSILAAVSQSSSSFLTQSGTGTVRIGAPLPTRSTMAQCSSRRCKVIQSQTPWLRAASGRTRAAMRVMLGRVFLSVVHDRVLAKVLDPSPRSANCRGASQLLHAFDVANTSRQISAEETAVGGLVCEPAHGTET
jgi:hypothetical protein